jgi:hypothetical protein
LWLGNVTLATGHGSFALLQLSLLSASALLLAFVSLCAEEMYDKYIEYCVDAWLWGADHRIDTFAAGKDLE